MTIRLIYRGPLIKDAPAELGDIRQWDIVAPGKPYNRMTVGVERLRQMGIIKGNHVRAVKWEVI